jgi:hypothetical protein
VVFDRQRMQGAVLGMICGSRVRVSVRVSD